MNREKYRKGKIRINYGIALELLSLWIIYIISSGYPYILELLFLLSSIAIPDCIAPFNNKRIILKLRIDKGFLPGIIKVIIFIINSWSLMKYLKLLLLCH